MATRPIKSELSVSAIPYFCPNCGAQVGEFVPVDNEVLLDAGGWLIGDGKRHCHRCGRLIHIKSPKDPWATLVQRYMERLRLAGLEKAAA